METGKKRNRVEQKVLDLIETNGGRIDSYILQRSILTLDPVNKLQKKDEVSVVRRRGQWYSQKKKVQKTNIWGRNF